jgi:hypothetical protein
MLMYGTDEGFWSESIDAVFDRMWADQMFRVRATYWRGNAEQPKATDFLPADVLLESVFDNACESCEDFGSAWISKHIPQTAVDDLADVINLWFAKHHPIDFFMVHDEEELTVTKEQFDEFVAQLSEGEQHEYYVMLASMPDK